MALEAARCTQLTVFQLPLDSFRVNKKRSREAVPVLLLLQAHRVKVV